MLRTLFVVAVCLVPACNPMAQRFADRKAFERYVSAMPADQVRARFGPPSQQLTPNQWRYNVVIGSTTEDVVLTFANDRVYQVAYLNDPPIQMPPPPPPARL